MIPADCHDGFFAAYWARPEAYLDPIVRAGISCCSLLDQSLVEERMDQLAPTSNTAPGTSATPAYATRRKLDVGYRLVISRLSAAPGGEDAVRAEQHRSSAKRPLRSVTRWSSPSATPSSSPAPRCARTPGCPPGARAAAPSAASTFGSLSAPSLARIRTGWPPSSTSCGRGDLHRDELRRVLPHVDARLHADDRILGRAARRSSPSSSGTPSPRPRRRDPRARTSP